MPSEAGSWDLAARVLQVDEDFNLNVDNLQVKNLNIKNNLWSQGDNGANADITVGGIHMVVKEGIITTLEEV